MQVQVLKCEHEAFTVTGVRVRSHCSTHDEDATGLLLTFYAHLIDAHGRRHTSTMTDPRGTLRRIHAAEAMSVLVNFDDTSMRERQNYAQEQLRQGSTRSEHALAARLIYTGLALLTYLITDEADTRETQARDKKARKREKPSPRSTVIEVGYRIGPALGTRQPASAPRTHGDGTRTVRTHIRRGHLRRVAHGPRRSLRRIQWIAPVVVGSSGGTSQVHIN